MPDNDIRDCAAPGCSLRTRHLSGRCFVHWPRRRPVWDGVDRPNCPGAWRLWMSGLTNRKLISFIPHEISETGVSRGEPVDPPAELVLDWRLLGLNIDDSVLVVPVGGGAQ